MTLTDTEFDAIAEVFNHVKGVIDEDEEQDEEYARTVFKTALAEAGGGIEAIGEPQVYRVPVEDIYALPDTFPRMYGLDASSTRTEELTNGALIDVANAKMTMLGRGGDPTVEDHSTIVAAVFSDDPTFGLDQYTAIRETGPIRTDLYTFREDEGRDDLKSWMSSVALALAEGTHAERLTPVDGLLFLDGPLYPTVVLSKIYFERGGSKTTSYRMPDSYQMKFARQSIQKYIDTIENQLSAGRPLVGITKSMTTAMLMNAIEDKVEANDIKFDLPWTNDYPFVSSVLFTPDPQVVTFTSWLVETQREANGSKVEPLADFDFTGDHDAIDFRRAFFYVRLPNGGPVFRVETPLVLAHDETRAEQLRMKVLKEVVEANDVPVVVKRADQRANITQQNSEDLKALLRQRLTNDYNTHGRGANRRYNTGGNEHHE
jgi:hypothetical protein